MPSYTYRCEDCKEEFTVIRKMTEETKECSKCNSENIKQIITPNHFILKGEGWFDKGGY